MVPDEIELRALLARPEGQYVEFKSLWHQQPGAERPLLRREVRDRIAEYVAAFANADGGRLILGVEDDGTPSGHGYPEEAVAEFLRVPENRLRPPLAIRSGTVVVDGFSLIVFDVPIAPTSVMVDGDGFPYRAGDQVIAEPQRTIDERKQAYRRVGFEQMVRSDASVSDLDLDLVTDTISQTPRGDIAAESWLADRGLVTARSEITNAALLLFACNPVSWHPAAGIRIFRVDGIERRHGAARNVTQVARIDEPVVRAIPEAYRVVSLQIRRSERLYDLFFREMPEYPTFAWQEALVNAVAHRDYANQTQGVEVWLYEDRLEVRSVGELVVPVTIEALRERRTLHASRNPLMTRVLAEARIMREEGEGIPRMFEEMTESFLRPPEFNLSDGSFVATLRNEPIFAAQSAEWQTLVDGLRISTNQKRALLAFPEGFTNEQYRLVNDVDRDAAYREIQELVRQGIVESRGTGRGASYRISSGLYQARGWLEARVPRLRQHFEHHEALTNTDYRSLFGITRYGAVAELRRLAQEGYLDLVGERRGARYLPGPNLR